MLLNRFCFSILTLFENACLTPLHRTFFLTRLKLRLSRRTVAKEIIRGRTAQALSVFVFILLDDIGIYSSYGFVHFSMEYNVFCFVFQFAVGQTLLFLFGNEMLLSSLLTCLLLGSLTTLLYLHPVIALERPPVVRGLLSLIVIASLTVVLKTRTLTTRHDVSKYFPFLLILIKY